MVKDDDPRIEGIPVYLGFLLSFSSPPLPPSLYPLISFFSLTLLMGETMQKKGMVTFSLSIIEEEGLISPRLDP